MISLGERLDGSGKRKAGLLLFGASALTALAVLPFDHGGVAEHIFASTNLSYPEFMLHHPFPAPIEYHVDDFLTELGSVGLLTTLSGKSKNSLAVSAACAMLGGIILEHGMQTSSDTGDDVAYIL